MPRYTLEFKAPRHTKWHALSVSALAPFPQEEIDKYRYQIAEAVTRSRGEACMQDMVSIRMLKDGNVYDGRDMPARNELERSSGRRIGE